MSSAARPVLLLDVMDTLVRDPVWKIPDFFGIDFETFWADKHPTAWVDFELGLLEEEQFLEQFFADQRDYDIQGFRELFKKSYQWIDGIPELLEELASCGIEMHALSNYPPWFQWIEDKLRLSRYLDWTFVSCLTGVRKPDREAYLGAATALARPPQDCVFVDDRGQNCKGAASVGMTAIRFDGAAHLRQTLSDLGLLSESSLS